MRSARGNAENDQNEEGSGNHFCHSHSAYREAAGGMRRITVGCEAADRKSCLAAADAPKRKSRNDAADQLRQNVGHNVRSGKTAAGREAHRYSRIVMAAG